MIPIEQKELPLENGFQNQDFHDVSLYVVISDKYKKQMFSSIKQGNFHHTFHQQLLGKFIYKCQCIAQVKYVEEYMYKHYCLGSKTKNPILVIYPDCFFSICSPSKLHKTHS